MYIEKRKLDKYKTEMISKLFSIILIIIFVSLFFAFWNIQVLKNKHYTIQALKNIQKTVGINAPRGFILSRGSKIIAENKINFSLFIIKKNIQDLSKTFFMLNSLFGFNREEFENRLNKYKNHPEFFRIPLKKNLELKDVIYIKSREEKFPEFEIAIEPLRTYPHAMTASHILGYISELSEKEHLEMKNYQLGDMIGKTGIEKQYEEYFRGKKGQRNVLVDNRGKVQRILSGKTPLIGKSVVLTINLELQIYIENLFKDLKGAVGVCDLKTGGLLAMVSKPNFNPEFFTSIKSEKEWMSLINNPAKPLHNKFTQGLYSPGSVFKIIMALAALEQNIIKQSTKSYCSGDVRIYGRTFHCWQKGGHGKVNVIDALKNSCNVFFYRLGKKMDIDVIAEYAELLGLGNRTNIDLPNENSGLIPTREWKKRSLKQAWFPGETISVSIGQGALNTTPAELLLMISTVALRGRMPRLHFLKEIRDGGKVIKKFEPSFKKIALQEKNFDIVIEGLFKVVKSGTAKNSRFKKLDICGKTGTAQIITKENPDYEKLVKQVRFKPHSWFVSFAPRVNPRIAMVVFVENGGDAAKIAVPLTDKIYKRIFEK